MNDYMNQKSLLNAKDEELFGKDWSMGISALSFPLRISAARRNMFAHHIKQAMNLSNPEIPKVMTNYENLFGKHSSGYKRVKEDGEVYAIVNKYDNREQGYFMFIYHSDTNSYEVYERMEVEDLTERYGFEYNNEAMDKLDEGSEVSKGDVLYRSTSYDDEMNYRYGLNGKFMYTLDPYTIEDAIVISESFAQRAKCTEVETFRIPLNDNMVLLNLYKDEINQYEGYKVFPDIGENTKGSIVCSSRQVHNSRILHDLSDEALRHIEFSRDTTTYAQGRIVDIKIYSNKPTDDIPNTRYTKQIKAYLNRQQRFYEEILEVTDAIINSGSKCSNEVRKLNKKAVNYLDEDTYWADNNRAFSNMIIEFTVAREEPLKIGQKITGKIAPSNREVCR